MQSYTETLDYLFTKLPMFTRIGAAAYKANLDNITELCEALGNPQNTFKSIHIAGTNGKGSTSSMLASVLQEHGYKTALFTSPHIKDFRERIRVNGKMVSEEWVVSFVEKHFSIIEKLKPSFFEISTAMAFAYYAELKVDIAIIEVGMGGLLDSTNIIHPILSIITNIGLDHTQFLGTTLAEVAHNKGGIIKPLTPVIISESQAETEFVFVRKANVCNAPIYFADTIYESIISKAESNNTTCIKLVHKAKMQIETYYLDLLGNYQTKNIKAVILACDVLQTLGFNISRNKIVSALQHVNRNTGIRARFELIQTKPTVIYDVAHNAEGIQLVLQQIENYKYNKLHIVCGFVADKDVAKVLKLFPKHAQYYFTQAQIPRALDATLLHQQAIAENLIGQCYTNVNNALLQAKMDAQETDIILVCGSFFLIAEIADY
jgi:dihydrofolate synthase / folylpolyglutamate synthase